MCGYRSGIRYSVCGKDNCGSLGRTILLWKRRQDRDLLRSLRCWIFVKKWVYLRNIWLLPLHILPG